jgi:hypothetical protein
MIIDNNSFFFHNLPIGSNLILVPFDLLVTTHLSQLLPTKIIVKELKSLHSLLSHVLWLHTP